MEERFSGTDPRYVPSWFWRMLVRSWLVQWSYVWIMRRLFRLRVRHPELVPRPPACIFTSNHGSHYDLFLALAWYRDVWGELPVPVVWNGVASLPVIGNLLQAVPCVWVNSDEDAANERMAAFREMCGHLRAGRSLLIASEGERHDQVGPFKDGTALLALHSGAKVVPVSLRGVQGLFSNRSWPTRFRGNVEFVLHAPLDPSDFAAGGGTRAEIVARFTDAIRAAVLSDLDYPAQELRSRS